MFYIPSSFSPATKTEAAAAKIYKAAQEDILAALKAIKAYKSDKITLLRDLMVTRHDIAADLRKSGATTTFIVALDFNDDALLVRIGQRGGIKVLWNFTTGKPRRRIG